MTNKKEAAPNEEIPKIICIYKEESLEFGRSTRANVQLPEKEDAQGNYLSSRKQAKITYRNDKKLIIENIPDSARANYLSKDGKNFEIIRQLAILEPGDKIRLGIENAPIFRVDYNSNQDYFVLTRLLEEESSREPFSAFFKKAMGLKEKTKTFKKKEKFRLGSKESSSEKILEMFEEISLDKDQPILTRELLQNKRFFPNKKISIGDKVFYFGDLIVDYQTRDQVLMFTKNEDGKMIPRFFYRSISSGSWRSCPAYIDQRGIFSKGKGINYTQETKPVSDIDQYLNSLDRSKSILVQEDMIKKYFSTERLNLERYIYTYQSEVGRYDDQGSLEKFQELSRSFSSPKDKKMDEDSLAKYLLNLKYPEGFIPDFNKNPMKTYEIQHPILGETRIEQFQSKLNGNTIIWGMAFTRNGEVWIDHIRLKNSKVNSYGIASSVIDSGFLTQKPIEYSNQVGGIKPGNRVEYIPESNGRYVSVTKILDNLLPIKKFREAKQIKKR